MFPTNGETRKMLQFPNKTTVEGNSTNQYTIPRYIPPKASTNNKNNMFL